MFVAVGTHVVFRLVGWLAFPNELKCENPIAFNALRNVRKHFLLEWVNWTIHLFYLFPIDHFPKLFYIVYIAILVHNMFRAYVFNFPNFRLVYFSFIFFLANKIFVRQRDDWCIFITQLDSSWLITFNIFIVLVFWYIVLVTLVVLL